MKNSNGVTTYIRSLKRVMMSAANPETATGMETYMRNRFQFYGIPSPQRRALVSGFYDDYGKPEPFLLKETVKSLWREPQRELHYTAQELLFSFRNQLEEKDIHLIHFMIVNNSWWDSIDFIAPKIAAHWFDLYPKHIKPVTGDWVQSDNFWLQRSALLFQLKYKSETDTVLMARYINLLSDSDEFFIRKAIGWLLREYSKTNPEWVQHFIQKNKLKPLSLREASKFL